MKKVLFAFLALATISACSNDKKKGNEKETTVASSNITYPYKADHSDFKMGNPNHTKMVLDFIKMWEENKLADMKNLLADTVFVLFNDGNTFMGTKDSLIKTGQMFRDNYSSIKTRLDAFMPVHSNDKNEDYVLIWGTDFLTDKSGKTDSLVNHAYFLVKDNKIAHWGEYMRKNPAPVNK